jgi:flagellar protein FlaG
MASIGSVGPLSPVAGADPRAPRAAPEPGAAAAAGHGSAAQPGQGAATAAQVKAAVEAANQQLTQSNRELTFVFDDTLGRMLVKIVDTRTNTVIRQVPSEDMLAAARALSGPSARGALIKGKA